MNTPTPEQAKAFLDIVSVSTYYPLTYSEILAKFEDVDTSMLTPIEEECYIDDVSSEIWESESSGLITEQQAHDLLYFLIP